MEAEDVAFATPVMDPKMTPPGDGSPAQSEEGAPQSTIVRNDLGGVPATRLSVTVNAIENLVNKEEFGIQVRYWLLIPLAWPATESLFMSETVSPLSGRTLSYKAALGTGKITSRFERSLLDAEVAPSGFVTLTCTETSARSPFEPPCFRRL
jgi:hypothetical protein